MKQFMEGIPMSLVEAAKIDGASQWRIFINIVMPNVKPAWLTLIIFSVQNLWNNKAATFIYSEEKKTLTGYSSFNSAGVGSFRKNSISISILSSVSAPFFYISYRYHPVKRHFVLFALTFLFISIDLPVKH